MELAIRLKENRNRIGLSQEEMADRIYVSRQTISNWETDRTYPDVQSLLLLSELFETSIDELVKGDVEIMEKAIENDWKTMSRLAVAGWGLTGVGIAALIVGFMLQSGPSSLSDKLTETEVLGLVLFLAGMYLLRSAADGGAGRGRLHEKEERPGHVPRYPRVFEGAGTRA